MGRRYGATRAVHALDLGLEAGEHLTLLGPNGAGKSTVLRMAAGVLLPSEGRVRVFGVDPAEVHGVRARIGYLSHECVLEPRETPAERIDFASRTRGGGGPGPEELKEALGLAEVWDRPCGGLSRGFQRRVELGAALAGGPELLLLDEPLAGLDEAFRRRAAAVVLELAGGAAVLVASHLPDQLGALASRVRGLTEGRAGPEV